MNSIKQAGFSTISVAIIVILLLAVGVGISFYSGKMTKPAETTKTPQSVQSPSQATHLSNTITGSFMDVILKGESIVCDWTAPAVSGRDAMPGKLYASAGKARSMATTTLDGGISMEANMIYKDEVMYSWVKMNGSSTFGFKMTKEQMDGASANLSDEQKKQGEQYRQKYTYACQPWVEDQSMFALPSGVSF